MFLNKLRTQRQHLLSLWHTLSAYYNFYKNTNWHLICWHLATRYESHYGLQMNLLWIPKCLTILPSQTFNTLKLLWSQEHAYLGFLSALPYYRHRPSIPWNSYAHKSIFMCVSKVSYHITVTYIKYSETLMLTRAYLFWFPKCLIILQSYTQIILKYLWS